MQKRQSFFPVFLLFFFLSVIIFFFSQRGVLPGVSGFFEFITLPVQRFAFQVFHAGSGKSEVELLREENIKLHVELAKQKELEKENKALHDQFQITNPSPKTLLPVTIIGRNDGEFIIDRGTKDGIKAGQVVVFQDNLVGIIANASFHRGVVTTIDNPKASLTAKAVKTGALGVSSGRGSGEIILNNVVLSEKLEKDDVVVTSGDVDTKGGGYPPDLIVGKIISINKRASSLFQQADLKSLLDFSRLSTVFVMTGE